MNELEFVIGEDGTATLYDDTYDVTIHCESEEEKQEVVKRLTAETKWMPCTEHPDTDRNVFIARGHDDFISCCIGHYDHGMKRWYEDRNWFAELIYDELYWCEMPPLPQYTGKQVTHMDIPEHIGTYTTEHIIAHTTDGTDEWNATRKERITRCADCIHYLRDATGVDGFCHGKRKYDTGFCDEAIRRT